MNKFIKGVCAASVGLILSAGIQLFSNLGGIVLYIIGIVGLIILIVLKVHIIIILLGGGLINLLL